MLAQDDQWKAYKLNIPRENITIVKAEQMFETKRHPGDEVMHLCSETQQAATARWRRWRGLFSGLAGVSHEKLPC